MHPLRRLGRRRGCGGTRRSGLSALDMSGGDALDGDARGGSNDLCEGRIDCPRARASGACAPGGSPSTAALRNEKADGARRSPEHAEALV